MGDAIKEFNETLSIYCGSTAILGYIIFAEDKNPEYWNAQKKNDSQQCESDLSVKELEEAIEIISRAANIIKIKFQGTDLEYDEFCYILETLTSSKFLDAFKIIKKE